MKYDRIGTFQTPSESLKTWQVVFATLNHTIQGGCAEAVKFAIQELRRDLSDGAQIVALFHDEIVHGFLMSATAVFGNSSRLFLLECNENDAEKVLKLAVNTMEEIASIISLECS